MNKGIKITNVFLAGIIISLFFLSCSKNNEEDNDDWNKCYNCTFDSWKGEFEGTCSYSDLNNNNDMKNLPITITLDSTGENYFYVSIIVVNYYSTNLSGEFVDPSIVNFASSNSSFSSSIYTKDSELKLSGNSKKFHKETEIINNDTIVITVIDEVVNFETLKIQ